MLVILRPPLLGHQGCLELVLSKTFCSLFGDLFENLPGLMLDDWSLLSVVLGKATIAWTAFVAAAPKCCPAIGKLLFSL